jgi:serine protease Do
MAKAVLMPLLKEGKVRRSWLGVSVEDLSPDLARQAGLPPASDGVFVSDVVEGGPGAQAGIKSGDVITSFDGAPMDDAQRMRWLAASGGVGKEVALGVSRAGHEEKLTARLGAMPDAESSASIPQPTEVGLLVRDVDVPTARSAGLALPVGAAVREVKPGSTAEKAGLRKGDVILKVDDLNISSAGTLSRALSRTDAGQFARVVARRGEQTVFIAMRKP